jgi:hypothetical protein
MCKGICDVIDMDRRKTCIVVVMQAPYIVYFNEEDTDVVDHLASSTMRP